MSIDHDNIFEQVAKEMYKLGYCTEGDFCRAMSDYIKGCDDRGIAPEKRMELLMPLYNFVRERVMIPRFPLYGTNSNCGINLNLAEEILSSVQGRLYLYLLTPKTGACKN